MTLIILKNIQTIIILKYILLTVDMITLSYISVPDLYDCSMYKTHFTLGRLSNSHHNYNTTSINLSNFNIVPHQVIICIENWESGTMLTERYF